MGFAEREDGFAQLSIAEIGISQVEEDFPAYQTALENGLVGINGFGIVSLFVAFIGLVEELNITVIVASHAWRHIKQLGLRRLAHHTRRSDDGRTTETVVSG